MIGNDSLYLITSRTLGRPKNRFRSKIAVSVQKSLGSLFFLSWGYELLESFAHNIRVETRLKD